MERAGRYQGLHETWNGSHWTAAGYLTGAGDVTLDEVSCVHPGDCFAVGSADRKGLVEHLAGIRWSAVAQPAAGAGTALTGVSCDAAGACTVAGTGASGAVVERGSGGDWQSQVPARVPRAELAAVSCPAARECLAVGRHVTGRTEYPLAEEWNGGAWRGEGPPGVKGAAVGSLDGIACPSTSFCVAVGWWARSPAGPQVLPLVDIWDGHRWGRQLPPVPTAARPPTVLTSVSCPSPRDGEAVGFSGTVPVAERWNGRTWRVQTTAAVGTQSVLSSVACSASTCRAVGSFSTSTAAVHALTELDTGRT